MVAYNRISQAENESILQYLMCQKDYLECINHRSRPSSMDGSGLNHMCQVKGIQRGRELEDNG